MKVRIYMDKGGVEKVAADQLQDLYHWHFGVKLCEKHYDPKPAEGSIWVSEELEISLPSREQSLPLAVAALEKERERIYGEAAHEVAVIKEKLNKLLAIGYEARVQEDVWTRDSDSGEYPDLSKTNDQPL